MNKLSIRKIVVLPLFIATLLTSFYVMQPQNAFAAHTEIYKDSGDDSGTPLASDRFNDIEERRAFASANQDCLTPINQGFLCDKIELELQQFIDCQTGTAPRGTCTTTVMSGTQTVNLQRSTGLGYTGYLDVEADLFMLQKDDTSGQDRVNNEIRGTQTVTATTSGTGTATIDISHNGDENELNMNMYQYNKRGSIDSEDRTAYSIDVEDAIADEDGGGNDDSKNKNTATQTYTATASDNSRITAATQGDQDFTIAQFNAGCDDTDPSYYTTLPAIDITCENKALQDILLQGSGGTATNPNLLNFETLSEIEMQQLNTCGFSQWLNCLNDGTLDVNVISAGAGETNVELENPNGNPVSFQENSCDNLNAGTQSGPNDCANVSKNIFDVQKSGTSNIEKTNLDLQVRQVNDCDSASARIDCVNQGRISDVDLEFPEGNFRDIGLLGPATTIVTVNSIGPGSNIEDADPDSFLTMVNDCDGARLSGTETATCTNSALNEAHFLAGNSDNLGPGGTLDVDRVVQTSELINNCDNLEATSTPSDADYCNNRATNSFTAISTDGAIININADITQTSYLDNFCYDAKCINDSLNTILLNANNGATIQTNPDSEGLSQTTDLLNDCSGEAICSNIAKNDMFVFAENSGSIIDLSKVNSQEIVLTNDCHTAITCSNIYTNDYDIVNTSGNLLTVSGDQSFVRTNTGGTFTETNTLNIAKSSGGQYTFTGTQSSINDPTPFTQNAYTAPTDATGSCTYSQTNGGTPQTSGTC